jgi:hypothetical protein
MGGAIILADVCLDLDDPATPGFGDIGSFEGGCVLDEDRAEQGACCLDGRAGEDRARKRPGGARRR